MSIIIYSSHRRFHECFEKEAENNKIEALHAYKEDECIALAKEHSDALVLVDAHSFKPYIDCKALMVVKRMRDTGLSNHALMLSWVPREYVLQHTSQNTDNNPCMSNYFNEITKQYIFKLLPIKREDLTQIITQSTYNNE